MREMVLNHISLRHPNRHTAVEWLTGMATGMLELHKNGVVEPTLSVSQVPGWPLFDVCQALPQDMCVFIMELFDKSRLLNGVDEDTKGCEVVGGEGEAQMLSPQDSVPLIFCANTNAIAVGFPSGIWDCDRITVNGEAAKTIDNLTRCDHARKICERDRLDLRFGNGAELWRAREELFPHLKFGLDVKGHLAELGGAAVQTAINRLANLNKLTAAWRNYDGAAPPQWNGVRNESKTVRRMNPELREKRRFRSHRGRPELFFWHTGFRGGKRIHFRFDLHKREVEIGYIGKKLPTKLFRTT